MDKLATKDTWIATGTVHFLLPHCGKTEFCISQGHYARKSWSEHTADSGASPRPMLLRPTDRNKDQTYYLSHMPEASLSRTLFPLAPYTKPEVREKAREWGLPTAERSESMGICFVGQKRRFTDFICKHNLYPPAGP